MSVKASKTADFNSVHYYGNLGFFKPKKKNWDFLNRICKKTTRSVKVNTRNLK